MVNILILFFSIDSHNHSQDPPGRRRLSDCFEDIEKNVNRDSYPDPKVLVKYDPFFAPIAEQARSGRILPKDMKKAISYVMDKVDISGPVSETGKHKFLIRWANLFTSAFSKYKRMLIQPKVFETVMAKITKEEEFSLERVLRELNTESESNICMMPYPRTWETVAGMMMNDVLLESKSDSMTN